MPFELKSQREATVAVHKSARVGRRPRNRPVGIRPRTRPRRPTPAKRSAMSARNKRVSSDDEVSRQIVTLAQRLKVIYAAAISVQLALRGQNAEFDADLAQCLRHGVCDPLADQIDGSRPS